MKTKTKAWRAKLGGVYYSVTSFLQVAENHDFDYVFNKLAFESGNYFKTIQQANEYREYCEKFFLTTKQNHNEQIEI